LQDFLERQGLATVSLKTSADIYDSDLSKSGMTFSKWVTALRLACSRRQKSAIPISENDCSSLPTTETQDQWATPCVPNGGRSLPESAVKAKGSTPDGKRQVGLEMQAKYWQTPRASEGEKGGPNARDSAGTPHLSSQAVTWGNMWPTPVVLDDNKSPEAHLAMKARMKGGPRKAITSLQVMTKLWPTPQCRDYRSPDLPESGNFQRKAAAGYTIDLNSAAAMWTTPKTVDVKHGTICPSELKRHTPTLATQSMTWPIPGSSLQDPTSSTSGQTSSPSTPNSRRQLNTGFVEWLMGVPRGLTNCAPWVTALFPSWWHTHSALLAQLSAPHLEPKKARKPVQPSRTPVPKLQYLTSFFDEPDALSA
jgi:hypothetical protein